MNPTFSEFSRSWAALIKRINRKLSHAGQKLKAAPSREFEKLGEYYVVDIETNVVVDIDVEPEELARTLGVRVDSPAVPSGPKVIPESEWSDGMQRVARYAQEVALIVHDREIQVQIVQDQNQPDFVADCQGGVLRINAAYRGTEWFDGPIDCFHDEVIIGAIGNTSGKVRPSDLAGPTWLAARLAEWAVEDPVTFKRLRGIADVHGATNGANPAILVKEQVATAT